MQVRVLIPSTVADRLDRLAERVPLVAGRSAAHVRGALAREAIAAGLEVIEADPARLVRPAVTKETK